MRLLPLKNAKFPGIFFAAAVLAVRYENTNVGVLQRRLPSSVTDPAKSNDNNRHLGAHNASKPMVTRESVCQQVRNGTNFTGC